MTWLCCQNGSPAAIICHIPAMLPLTMNFKQGRLRTMSRNSSDGTCPLKKALLQGSRLQSRRSSRERWMQFAGVFSDQCYFIFYIECQNSRKKVRPISSCSGSVQLCDLYTIPLTSIDVPIHHAMQQCALILMHTRSFS